MGFIDFEVCKKLCVLNENIKSWKREVLGQMDKDRDGLIKIVEDLDKVGDNRELQLDEIDVKEICHEENLGFQSYRGGKNQ